MCGIFGYIGSAPDSLPTKDIIGALSHRGPDGSSSILLPEVLLAHTRLSILDLSERGTQPMVDSSGSTWIVFNGEIYNYLELKQELTDYPFRTDSDTEVILAAYRKWGEDCLHYLRGMFSFALYDQQHKKLFGAVDRFGIKPFLYHVDGDSFRFSSEAKALAASGIVLKPDDTSIHDYLIHGHLYHDSRTFFHGISTLPAAHKLRYSRGKLEIECYWSLSSQAVPELSEEELVEYTDQQLRESVRLHLRSDVEYGLSLSSGLDSNFLRCLLKEEGWLKKPLNCFSFCYPGTPYDECIDIQEQIVEGAIFHKSSLTSDMLFEALPRYIYAQEGPVGGVGMFGFWKNMQLAQKNGIKVIINGQGADELFLGYKHYYELRLLDLYKRGQLDELNDELQGFNRWNNTDYLIDDPGFVSWLQSLSTSSTQASDGTSLGGCAFVNSDFLHGACPEPLSSPRESRFSDPVKRRAIVDLQQRKVPKLLTFQDRLSMDCSVEVRVPFLDHVLFESLFSLPTHLLLQGGKSKLLLRKVAKQYPDPLLRQYWSPAKKYMPTPQREWLKTELCETIREMIANSCLHDLGYIDKYCLSREYEDYVISPALGNAYFIWKFINLEMLFRVFFLENV